MKCLPSIARTIAPRRPLGALARFAGALLIGSFLQPAIGLAQTAGGGGVHFQAPPINGDCVAGVNINTIKDAGPCVPTFTGDMTNAGTVTIVSKVSGSAGTPTTFTTYNATSGSITVSPPTGALGTLNLTWPSVSGIIPAITGTITAGDCAKFASASSIEDGGSCGGGSMVYPGAGVAVSTGSGWGQSYAVSGSGNIALTTNAHLTLPELVATSISGSCTAGSIGYSSSGTGAFSWCNQAGQWVNTGTTTLTYVATGCTPSASALDATGGTITLAAGPCTQIVLTFNGATGMTATHAWVCSVSDRALNGPTSWFGSWGEASSTSTTATIDIPPAAGPTDTISFACSPH